MAENSSLVDVTPSLLAGLGVPGFTDTLGVAGASSVCLLLVDGLGWELLRANAAQAPFLAGLAADAQPINAGFPATTATSVATLGTGLTAGEHGIVGLSFQVPDLPLVHALTWRGVGTKDDLRDVVVPEQTQPLPTAFERAEAAGVAVTVSAPPIQRRSGLTRAVLRGGHFQTSYALGDLVTNVRDALRTTPAFCYAYHGDLDLVGHAHGPGSDAWRYQLRAVDRLAADIATVLPPDGLLAVVADHGMVRLAQDEVVDADTTPELLTGVQEIGGDIRARHVYTEPGAEADVLAAWRSVLSGRAAVMSREEAVADGWFGPHVSDLVLPRIGDVVTASGGGNGVLRSKREPIESRMIGHHASHSSAEQLVPFLTVRG
ncbi:MAG TPA: nucleotide pyrophosphatase/phosphodiesterase family protein [Pseudonocardiaceae bacterium]|nr:nucleotide pyrophosphatase/phosphodiesterase family protein [Pseudonocardiaceae bacterium]